MTDDTPALISGKESLHVPEEVLQRWAAIDRTSVVRLELTRERWDDFLISLIGNHSAIASLRNSIAAVILGNKSAAIEQLNGATREIDSNAQLVSAFLTAVMNKASESDG